VNGYYQKSKVKGARKTVCGENDKGYKREGGIWTIVKSIIKKSSNF
jgi:hypothetical protein